MEPRSALLEFTSYEFEDLWVIQIIDRREGHAGIDMLDHLLRSPLP